MDHFFFGVYNPSDRIQNDEIVYLEMSGGYVYVVHGKEGILAERLLKNTERFDNVPAALRRMADIIEQHQKKQEAK